MAYTKTTKLPRPKEIREKAEAIVQGEDPVESIAQSMADRGFSSLWTAVPVKAGNLTRIDAFTDERKLEFLRAVALSGRMNFASAKVGVSNWTINELRKTDQVFAIALAEAMGYFRDLLEQEMYRRGVSGFEEGVVGGKDRDQIIMVPKYSDRMLELLARIHMPELKKQAAEAASTVDNSHTVTVNNFDFSSMPPEDLEVFRALLEKQNKRLEQKASGDEKVISGEVINATKK
jgi:hypothetical protein